MTSKRKPKAKPTPGQFPSQTYAAREGRGRPIVALSLSAEARDKLRAMSASSGESMSAIVERLIDDA